MPLNSPVYFQPLSFQQANPLLAGMQAGAQLMGTNLQNQLTSSLLPYAAPQAQQQLLQAQLDNQKSQQLMPFVTPSAQQGLLQQQLANKTTQAGLPYVGPQAQANVGLTQAQGGLYGTEEAKNQWLLQHPAAMLPGTAGQIGSLQYLQQFLPQMSSSNGGMTITPTSQMQNSPTPEQVQNAISQTGIPFRMPLTPTAPIANNNYPTLPGGLSPQQGQQLNQQLSSGALAPQGAVDPNSIYGLQMRNLMMQIGKNPAFGSQRSGAGGTYYDPTTGQYISTPTSANTTLAQRNITSLQRVQPLLDQLSGNLSQFQTAAGDTKLKAQQLGNYILGQNNPLPNQYAQGQQALQTAPESLLRSWGLNVTNESLQRMEDAVKPIFGESPTGYQNRIVNTLSELQDMQKQAQQQLSQGIPLDSGQQPVGGTVQMQKTINGDNYVQIDGQWYQQ